MAVVHNMNLLNTHSKDFFDQPGHYKECKKWIVGDKIPKSNMKQGAANGKRVPVVVLVVVEAATTAASCGRVVIDTMPCPCGHPQGISHFRGDMISWDQGYFCVLTIAVVKGQTRREKRATIG